MDAFDAAGFLSVGLAAAGFFSAGFGAAGFFSAGFLAGAAFFVSFFSDEVEAAGAAFFSPTLKTHKKISCLYLYSNFTEMFTLLTHVPKRLSVYIHNTHEIFNYLESITKHTFDMIQL